MRSQAPLRFTVLITGLTYVAVNGSRLALPLFALDLSAPPSAVGIIAALLWVFPLIASWPIGTLADRYGARWLLVAGAACGFVGMLAPFVAPGMSSIYLAALLSGLWNAVYHVTTLSLMGILSAPDKRSRSFVWYSMIGSTTNFIGPLVTGFSIQHWGYSSSFLVLAISPAIVTGLLLVKGGMLPRGQSRQQPVAEFHPLLSDRTLLRVLLIGGCVQLGVDLFPFLMPIYGRSIALSAGEIGSVVSLISVSSFLMQLLTPRAVARFGEERAMALAFSVTAVSFLLIPTAADVMTLGAVAFLFGFSLGSGQPISTTMLFSHFAKSSPGRALGLRLTFNNFVRVATPAAMGSLASLFGLAAICGIGAVVLVAGSALCRPWRQSTRARPFKDR